jgi:hypothetical protein
MIYLLSRSFSPLIALPCTLSLTFMAYHISLSQDGRSYALVLFLGMSGLYFLMKHMKTSKKRYLIPAALSFALSFYTNYAFTPFIALFQVLWFYQTNEETKKPVLASVLFFNGLLLLFCFSWVPFAALSYQGPPFLDPLRGDGVLGSFWSNTYNLLHDWTSNIFVTIPSILFLILLPYFSKIKVNALILLGILIAPIGGTYLFCKLFNITHFITSRYLVNLLPIFFISIYLSLNNLELRFERLKRVLRLKHLFILLFIASNLVILPFYYRAGKQDFMGLVAYLKNQLREGDKIYVISEGYVPGILHYFGAIPEGRNYRVTPWEGSEKKTGFKTSFVYQDKLITIYHSKRCCTQYVNDGTRLWLVTPRWLAEKIKSDSPCILKGYFDGSFLNFTQFPIDASMYLFLWDPKSPEEKGIDMPIE